VEGGVAYRVQRCQPPNACVFRHFSMRLGKWQDLPATH
jgi:hypothetical protein